MNDTIKLTKTRVITTNYEIEYTQEDFIADCAKFNIENITWEELCEAMRTYPEKDNAVCVRGDKTRFSAYAFFIMLMEQKMYVVDEDDSLSKANVEVL